MVKRHILNLVLARVRDVGVSSEPALVTRALAIILTFAMTVAILMSSGKKRPASEGKQIGKQVSASKCRQASVGKQVSAPECTGLY